MNLSSMLSGILSSIIASFVFLFIVLIFFKPKMRISPFIIKGKFGKDEQADCFFIKLINVSLFSAYDLHFELFEVDHYPAVNGHINHRFKPIEAKLNHISHVPGYRPSWLIKNAPYAIRVRTSEDLLKIIEDEQKSVMLKVSLRHGLTGLVRVISKEYVEVSQIKSGKFGYGLKFVNIK
jgi:hypothetical protein